MIHFSSMHLFVGLTVLVMALFLLHRQKRGFWYLFFFSLFWVYLLFVVRVIAFPIVPLEDAYRAGFLPRINLIPFYFGTCDMAMLCLREILENILLTIPFGFGIRFLLKRKRTDFVFLALCIGFIFEATQLIISSVFFSPFRAVDINDIILNATGVMLGYGLFHIFGRLYVAVTHKFTIDNKHIFAFIYDAVRQSNGPL